MAFRRAEGGNLKPEEKSHCDKPGPLSSTALVSGYRSEVATLPAPISALSFQVSDFEKVRLLALDFDGVLTDNRVLVSEDGTESVLCDRGDGFGIGLLNASVVAVVVISKEKNPVVAARCHKLGIECLQSCDDKLPSLQALCSSRNLSAAEVAYVGNDLNDLECLRWVGLPIAVSDAVPEVLSVAKWVTTKPGGHGAVREICDMLLTKGPIT